MKEIQNLKIQILKYSLFAFVLINAVAFFLVENFSPFLLGTVFGLAVSVLNFFDLANTMTRATSMTPSQAQIFASLKYFVRYALTGLVIYVSIKADYINVLGTISGLVTIKTIIILTNVMKKKQRKEGE